MRKHDPQREVEIAQLYAGGKFLTEHIAKTFGVSRRHVQYVAKKYGVSRSQADANRLATPLKRQSRIRRKRTHYIEPD